MDPALNWREILKRYIVHVGAMEGVDFLGHEGTTDVHGLTPDENLALAKARDEAWAEYAKET